MRRFFWTLLSLTTLTTMSCDSTSSPKASPVPVELATARNESIKETPEERALALELQAALAAARAQFDPARFDDLARRTADAVAAFPKSRPIRHVHASALLATGRAHDALLEARNLASDANDAIAAGLLADALMATGDIASAVDATEHLMTLAPGLPAYARAAQLRFATGDVEGSVEMWREAFLAGHKSEPEALAFCAASAGDVVLHGAGDPATALKFYEDALAAVPAHPDARLGRARIHFAAGRARDALQDIEAISPAARTAAAASFRTALLKSLAKNESAASALSELWTTFAAREPVDTAFALAVRGVDVGRARELVEPLVSSRRSLQESAALAYVLARGGAPADTVKGLATRAAATGTADSRILALSGTALLRAGDADAARALLRRVKPVGLDPALASEVRAALGGKQ